jgi:hypothetical protein
LASPVVYSGFVMAILSRRPFSNLIINQVAEESTMKMDRKLEGNKCQHTAPKG